MQTTRKQNSGLGLVAKLLRHFEMNEDQVVKHLGGDHRVVKALIKGARIGMEKGEL